MAILSSRRYENIAGMQVAVDELTVSLSQRLGWGINKKSFEVKVITIAGLRQSNPVYSFDVLLKINIIDRLL